MGDYLTLSGIKKVECWIKATVDDVTHEVNVATVVPDGGYVDGSESILTKNETVIDSSQITIEIVPEDDPEADLKVGEKATVKLLTLIGVYDRFFK